ncbi:MAG: PhzF family phenazine biosynthesis protein [Chloroherpetonaceae bacterium]|nr:PhzF family phenazine biosynthesis protein [Chloroherpetonaceae bacterium]MCS7211537.1 PhzF family phenazine biosynthesis protein [Chloroherpetonaceae bacterium]MDW8019829.1 PhzF family phenazine biosynthesis protein [Chloroherpetonaceae bacterium]
MRTYKFKHIDAFTDRAYTGNPAAVIMHAEGLTDEEMHLLARELNLSETAFVIPPKDGSYDLELRWMTPTTEVDLCGHATVAAFHALAEVKLYDLGHEGERTLRVKTRSGILPIRVQQQNGTVRVTMGLPLPTFTPYKGQKFELCQAFSVPTELLDHSLPVWLANNGYIFIPFVNREPLLKMKPSFTDLRNLSQKHNITGFCVFTTDTKYATSAAHSRFFAPALGINEDPVTGSAQGPLAVYLYQNGRIKGEGRIPVTLEQGYEMGRGGRVWAEIEVENGAVQQLWISGYAVTVMNGELYI